VTSAKLVHVGTAEVQAKRYFPWEDKPSWGPGGPDGEGGFNLQAWNDSHVMVLMSASLEGQEHAVKVTIAAMYELEDGVALSENAEERREFLSRHTEELIPFLRQAVYNASSQVWPIKPILMDPVIKLGE
jgi:hypothetical protein